MTAADSQSPPEPTTRAANASPGWRRKIARGAIGLSILAGATVGLGIGLLLLSEWQPPTDETYAVTGGSPGPLPATLRLISWNVGYAAMDRQTDFFMDGGRMSRGRSAAAVQENLTQIQTLLQTRRPDVALLQEVDQPSTRSYRIDERAQITAGLPDYAPIYTLNYNVPYVPVPLRQPMGGARSGLLTLSRVTPIEAHGLRLPGRQAFPNRLFNLKRTVSLLRLPAPSGRQLVLIHAHLTAFDSVGNMRQLESAFVRDIIVREQAQGHHVVIGGDWNSALPGSTTPPCSATQDDRSWLVDMPPDYAPPGFRWAVGTNAPTVRTLGAPRNGQTTCYAYIDGFLLSPGITLRRVETLDLGFQHSDHKPVEIEITLP